MLGQLQRYRSLLVVVATIATLVFVIRDSDRGGITSVGADGSSESGAPLAGVDPQAGADGASGSDTGGPLAAGGAGAAGGRSGPAGTSGGATGNGGAGSTGEGGPTAAAPVAGPGFPGYGTPEALKSPKCDPATGKIRIPYTRIPQCVREWPAGANNGGATSTGVTADKITVVFRYPNDYSDDEVATFQREANACASLQQHYELWGRALDLKFHRASGTDETAQRADAAEMINRYKPFFSLSIDQVATPIFDGEMAGRGAVVFAFVSSWKGDHAQPGMRFSFSPDDRLAAWNVAEWVGKRLATRPAQWAGDPALRVKARKYGLVYGESIPLDVNDFKAQLAAYGIELAEVVAYPDEVVAQQNQARTAIAKLSEAGVTSVINFGDIIYSVLLTTQATQDRYNPEWIVTGSGNIDTQVAGKLMDQTQWAHAFGIGGIAVPVDGHVHAGSDTYEWQNGRPYEDAVLAGEICSPMWNMLAGVQLAGPQLTPETFKRGMFDYNSNGGRWQNMTTLGNEAHSYGRDLKVPWDDYSGQDDYVEKWWDATTTGTDEIGLTAPGVYWKLNGGKRYLLGDYPSGEPPMFSKEGAISKYPEYPPSDRAPSYPRPG